MEGWERFRGFQRFVPPSGFAQEFLFFSDGYGLLDDPAFHIRREKFNNYILMLVTDGLLHVHQFGKHLTLGKGQAVVLHLEPPHEYYPDKEEPCTILFLHMSGRGCPPLMGELERLAPFPAVFGGEPLYPLLAGCFDAVQARDGSAELTVSQTIYSVMLTLLSQNMRGAEPLSVVPRELFLNRVDAYIGDHICDSIPLDALAGAVNMSKYYFCRRFKEESGVTPMQYVVKKKVDASKYFLQYTGESIQMVAERFGFTDQSHYAKQFKRFTGMTPRAYRGKGQG